MKHTFKAFIKLGAICIGTFLIIAGISFLISLSHTSAAAQVKEPVARNVTSNLTSLNTNFITHPAIEANKMLKVKSTSIPSALSQIEALQVVHNAGIPWALGGLYNNKTVTITSIYGLATLGFAGDTSNIYTAQGTHPSGNCANWFGPCDFPISSCNLGKCVDTGRVIDRFENRPMWIIDYGNTLWQNGGSGSAAPASNHTVYLVDVAEKVAIVAWGYQSN